MKTESRIKRGWILTVSVRMLLVAIALTAGLASVHADEASCDAMAPSSNVGLGVGIWSLCCPDDYVRKPSPCVTPVACRCADRYCSKPGVVLPCPQKQCSPDNYCPKPVPSLCRPIANEWYKCVTLPLCHWLHPTACTGNNQ